MATLVYFGQSKNLRRRERSHWATLCRGIHGNSRMQRAWNKYGRVSFSFHVLEIVEISDLDASEQRYLDLYRYDENCMNMAVTAGSMKGWRMPASVRKQMSASHMGKKHTEEDRKKISVALSGRKFSEEHRKNLSRRKVGHAPMIATIAAGLKARKPVIGTCISTGKEIRFDYIRAVREAGFTNESVVCCCKNRQKSHKGHTWRYDDNQAPDKSC